MDSSKEEEEEEDPPLTDNPHLEADQRGHQKCILLHSDGCFPRIQIQKSSQNSAGRTWTRTERSKQQSWSGCCRARTILSAIALSASCSISLPRIEPTLPELVGGKPQFCSSLSRHRIFLSSFFSLSWISSPSSCVAPLEDSFLARSVCRICNPSPLRTSFATAGPLGFVPLWKELKKWQVCSPSLPLSLCGLFLVAFFIFLLNFSDAFFVADSGNSWTGVSTSLQSGFL